jgi:chitin disaccharide deacetylase
MTKPRHAIKCIVNADDFGISEDVNSATVELMEKGAVTSATIMANGPAFDQAILAARKLPNCSFGVHLNVTQFGSLTKNAALNGIRNATGEFSGARLPNVIWPSMQQAILEEFQLQIDRVRSALGEISHIDSHHHIHTKPALFPVLVWLVRANGIKVVRLTKNLYPKEDKPGAGNLLKKQMWNTALRTFCAVRTSDYFGDMAAFHSNAAHLDGAVVEIMTHPGHPGYAEETKLIDSDWRSKIDANIEMIGYRALMGGDPSAHGRRDI